MTNALEHAQQDLRAELNNASWEKRQEVLKQLADTAGLRLPETILPEGTALLASGESAKREMARKLDQLPSIELAIAGMSQRLGMESPMDFSKVKPGTLRLDPTSGAKLYRVSGTGVAGSAVAYNATGFAHVAQFIKPRDIRNGFTENMLALPPPLRAQVFNHWAQNTLRNDDGLTLRTLVEPVSQARYIRAVTSSKHSLETGDDTAVLSALTTALGGQLPKGAKARFTREADRSEFELIWPALKREVKVGDAVQIGVRIVNSETKAGALKVEAFVLRAVCYNFTTAYSMDSEAVTMTLRHIGDLRTRLPRLLFQTVNRVEPLIVAFSDAYNVELPQPRGDMLAKARKALQLPEHVIELAAKVWDADGPLSAGNTLAGLTNALSHAAKSLPVEAAGDVERASGQLLAQGLSLLRM